MERIGYFVAMTSALTLSSLAAFVVRSSRERLGISRGICVELPPQSSARAPGSRASRMTIVVGFAVGMIVLFLSLALCLLGRWSGLPAWALVPLPTVVRATSVVLIWVYYGWGVAVVAHNANYTPCYRALAGQYHITTSGPYRIVRHPMYVAKAVFPVLLFLATGLWISLLGLLSWTALGYQANAEEQQLLGLAGEPYRSYLRRTGRFIPSFTRQVGQR